MAAGRGFSLRLSCTFGRNKPRTCARADRIKRDNFSGDFCSEKSAEIH